MSPQLDPDSVPSRRIATEDLIRVIAVSTSFGPRRVLRDVDLAVRRGEVFVVMGPSGCGKTTLLKHINGLLPPTTGGVYVDGRDLYLMPVNELQEYRQRTGMSFQAGALLNSLTVLENVMLPLRESTKLGAQQIREVARMKLDMVGLLPAADLLPAGISGGMRKRAAVARAIALDPEILFFDEPSAGLDPITAAGMDNLILKLNQVFGITTVVVTHDLDSAFAIADRIAMILEGRIAACGSREEIKSSADKRIQDFIRRRMPEETVAEIDLTRYLAT
jgi:phospholipid/cholesterol/gamma-HCH transport system ATP-binding protein